MLLGVVHISMCHVLYMLLNKDKDAKVMAVAHEVWITPQCSLTACTFHELYRQCGLVLTGAACTGRVMLHVVLE